MKANIQQLKTALRMVPLLRSISREMNERVHAIAEAECLLEACGSAGCVGECDAATLELQLSVHRRELNRVERELANIGWVRDEDHPLRLLMRGSGRDAQIAWRPEESGRGRSSADSAA